MHMLVLAYSTLMPGPRECGLYYIMQGECSIKMIWGGRGRYASNVERDQTCFSLFLGATKHLYKTVCPSVHPSVLLAAHPLVRLSVCPSRLLIHHLIEMFWYILCYVHFFFIRDTFIRDSAWIFVKNSEQIKNKPRLNFS